jgi:hypothetical protein
MPAPVIAEEVDNKLRALVGPAPLRECFTPEKMHMAEAVVEQARGRYFDEIRQQIEDMKQVVRKFREVGGTEEQFIDALQRQARELRSGAETMGFQLITKVANSLTHFCDLTNPDHPSCKMVAQTHLDAIEVACREHIQDEGGSAGRSLIHSIEMLVQKIQKEQIAQGIKPISKPPGFE